MPSPSARPSLLAAGSGDPGRGTLLQVIDVDPDAPYTGTWDDDLALWAGRRPGADLAAAVVSLTAPELAADRLVGVPEMASITGIAASTLRAYASRGEADLPLPQAVIGGRALWSRPVADEWAEARRRHPDVIGESVAVPGPDGRMVPIGEAELAAGLERSFHSALWDYRPVRSRWALRWRNPASVREVASSLAASTASYVLRSLIPGQDLITAVASAVLWEFAQWQRLNSSLGHEALTAEHPAAGGPGDYYPVGPPVARMYGWLVRHNPWLRSGRLGCHRPGRRDHARHPHPPHRAVPGPGSRARRRAGRGNPGRFPATREDTARRRPADHRLRQAVREVRKALLPAASHRRVFGYQGSPRSAPLHQFPPRA